MNQHDFTGKEVYVFVTHGGSGYGNIINDLREALPNATVKPLLSMNDRQANSLSRAEIRQQVQRALRNQ